MKEERILSGYLEENYPKEILKLSWIVSLKASMLRGNYNMKVLERVNWGYILFETDDGIYLDVVCGTVAIFDLIIKLTDNEIQKYHSDVLFIKSLADDICSNPHAYNNRRVANNFSFPPA